MQQITGKCRNIQHVREKCRNIQHVREKCRNIQHMREKCSTCEKNAVPARKMQRSFALYRNFHGNAVTCGGYAAPAKLEMWPLATLAPPPRRAVLLIAAAVSGFLYNCSTSVKKTLPSQKIVCSPTRNADERETDHRSYTVIRTPWTDCGPASRESQWRPTRRRRCWSKR